MRIGVGLQRERQNMTEQIQWKIWTRKKNEKLQQKEKTENS